VIAELPWLLLWGTFVGVDLISWPQSMVARPLVSGIVAGWIVGDVAAGAAVGVVLELFALELLPVGAARYPDYGVATVAATAAASGAPDVFGVGPGVLLGLALAYLGQESIHLARRRTALDVRAAAAALDAGDPGAIRRVHFRGLGRDALRALIVTAIGLLGALALRTMPPIGVRGGALLLLVALGAAIGVASLGAARLAGSGVGRVWLAAGLTLGLVWVILQ
jgi:PTS system mannose-specific IIC component